MAKHLIFLLLIFIFVFALYHPIFSVYFSHDDFFHLNASQTDGTIRSFVKLFGFPTFEERGYGFYRPLTREAFFNIYYSLFGLNHFPARALSLGIHFINIILVYLLMQKLFKRRELSLFTAFFFGITAANVGSLYYLAGGIQVLVATSFMLLTVLLFPRKIAFFTFLLALGSHELASVIPAVLVGIAFIQKNLLKNLKFLGIFFIVLISFIYLDATRIGFSSGEKQYQLNISPKAFINSFSWYSLWAFGFPEMLLDFVGPKLSLNPNLMKFWGDYFAGIFFFGGAALTIFAASFIWALLKARIWKDRQFWFLLIWFPIALSPVILFPLHKQTYYLNPALPAFWGVVGFIIFKVYEDFCKRNNNVAGFVLGIFITSIFLLSATSAILANSTYPAVNRGKIAEKLLRDISAKYPSLSKGSVLYIKNDPGYPKISGDWGGSSKQAAFALNGSDALQLVYRDPTLRVIYEDLDKQVPDGAYSLVARVN